MGDDAKRLLLLCHDGGWDRLHQAASAAATAASTGWRVDLVFYYGALEKLLDGRLDEAPEDGPLAEIVERAEERGVVAPAALLAAARRTGQCRVLACSASLGLIGRDPDEVDPAVVEDLVGWPTTLAMIERADRVLYL